MVQAKLKHGWDIELNSEEIRTLQTENENDIQEPSVLIGNTDVKPFCRRLDAMSPRNQKKYKR